ncbi:hypothetical protein FLK61_35250 [Paenalkalicoccus suaedae]|uniref:YopX protein domain-containing protein n=1 Tax=Paenalkalicoccus suaedae TaxID=2592382 RepID=A0A859FFP8_9BACI|nr:YopX family protein [Paenalkalicoccus suaedae]QKS71927.1 hypothetical protein FLK61_35250 [Paenalkalicoccus suaedae]
MRRELEYKAYAVDKMAKSQWIYGFGIDDVQFTKEYVNKLGRDSDWWLYSKGGTYLVHQSSVGKFTGLVDIAGQKIYSNHILEDDEKFLWTIIYKNGAYYAVCNDLMVCQLLSTVNLHCKIKGNTFEHSDLLESQ